MVLCGYSKKKRAYKVKRLYQCLRISKQAYYERLKANKDKDQRDQIVLDLVRQSRKTHSKAGTRKLIKYIRKGLVGNNIKMGREALFDLLRSYGMLVKKTKRYHITTDSNDLFYKSANLIKDIGITHSEQVFVSDITYIKTDNEHAYLALVTDAYSKKLIGMGIR